MIYYIIAVSAKYATNQPCSIESTGDTIHTNEENPILCSCSIIWGCNEPWTRLLLYEMW